MLSKIYEILKEKVWLSIGPLSKEQLIKFERSARRQADIESGIGVFKSKVHKSAKDYNRRENKKIVWNNLDY